jgi:hypothetical protein
MAMDNPSTVAVCSLMLWRIAVSILQFSYICRNKIFALKDESKNESGVKNNITYNERITENP